MLLENVVVFVALPPGRSGLPHDALLSAVEELKQQLKFEAAFVAAVIVDVNSSD